MAQWTNVLWNNSFVNPTSLPLPCRNAGAIHLAQPGLTASWVASKWNAGKFWIFKLFAAFNQVTALLGQYKCI